jgi:hypothetical protein
MNTETGVWNSATWALMGIAVGGLLPAGLGLYFGGGCHPAEGELAVTCDGVI